MLLANHCYLCGGKSISNRLICEPCWFDLSDDKTACYRCGRGLVYGELCAQCLENPGFVDNTITLFPYQFPGAKLLRSLKYKNQLLLANEFGNKLVEKIQAQSTLLPDRIIPVPLHPIRLFFRGYNQALEIARTISTSIAVPLDYKTSKRIRNTPAQFNLNPAQRKLNISGAFKICEPVLSGSVAIVDDIVTTGHTANELAKQLKAAGVSYVSLWACAHSG